MTQKITPARRRALEAVRDNKVTRKWPWSSDRKPYWGKPDGVRSDTVDRLLEDKLIVVLRNTNATTSPVQLTDAGREALR